MRGDSHVNTRKTYILRLIAVAALSVISAFWMLAASAADTRKTANKSMEEIVVTGHFVSATGESGLKSDVPLRDVPMTVTGYTDSFMQAIETSRIADLYNYMAGVQKAGPTGYDISIRGFSSSGNDRNAIQIDGLPGLAVRFGSPPTINAQRIEVVKGPAAVLYGQIQPGGFINVITKKPQATPFTQFRVLTEGYYGSPATIGKTGGISASVDSTGPVNSDGTVLYRVVGQVEDFNTFRNNGFSKTQYLVPSVTWNINDGTSLRAFAEYRHENDALDNYLVAYNNDINNVASVTTRYQEPGDSQPETGAVGGLEFSHDISDNLHWRVNYRYVWHKDSALGYENLSFRDATTLRRRDRNQQNHRSYNFIDTNLVWDTQTGAVQHKIMVGFNGGKETAHFTRVNFDNNNPTLDINIYNPVYGQGIPNTDRNVSDNDRFRNFKSSAAYAQDQLTFSENWKAVLAVRYESYKTDQTLYQPEFPTPVYQYTQYVSDHDVSKMAGLIYQPDEVWSLYVSYAESFNPPTWGREDANANPISSPERGSQVEGGFKADFDFGTITASIYSIKRKDIAEDTGLNNTIDGNPIYALAGEEKSHGFDLEANANITPKWQMIAGFAYVDATVVQATTTAYMGQELLNAPKESGSVWNRYQFNDNWGIGLGIKYAAKRYGSAFDRNGDQSARLILPSYWLVDLGAYYTSTSFDATLKFSNLFNETYYESATRNTNIVPGAPAWVTLSITKRL